MKALFGSILVFVLAAAASAPGGVLVTRDGKSFDGPLRIDGQRIGVVQDNKTQWFEIANVASADFKAGSSDKPRAGHGLRGEYFTGRNFQKLLLIRNDPLIDYRWEQVLPHPALCPTGREFSVRWTGRLKVERTDKYQLITDTDDGVRVWIDEKLIIDRWWDQSGGDYGVEFTLEAGRMYKLRVEYYNGADIAKATLAWSCSQFSRQPIPTENLYLPEGVEDPANEKGLIIDAPAADGGPPFVRLIRSDSVGLRAEYYSDREFQKLAFIRFDPNIDVNYTNENPPDPAMAPEGSVRWTGLLDPRVTEEYRFHAEAHRRIRLWVNGNLLIDKWNTEGGEFSSEAIRLEAGKPVPVKIEFSSSAGFMLCRLRWSSASAAHREVIPAGAFTVPNDSKISRPVVGLVYPGADVILSAPRSVALLASGMSPNGPVQRVEFFDRSGILGAMSAQPYRLMWNQPTPGVYELRAKLTDSLGVTALSDTFTVSVTGRGDGSLKAPWGDFYITNNEYTIRGEASVAEGGRFRIGKATGTLLSSGDNDSGHFVVQPLVGDGQIVARLVSLDPKDPAAVAMAGITIRQSLKNRCKQTSLLAGVAPTGDPGVHFVRRHQYWANPVSAEKRMEVPCWLKLLRHSGRVYAYVSPDGKNWELISAERFDTAPQVLVGLVALAENKDKPAAAVFDNVTVTPGSPALEAAEKGFVTRGGTFVAADVYQIDGNLVRYARNGQNSALPLADIARIVYRPLLTDHAAKLRTGMTGLLMGSGDFFEGDVKSIEGGQVGVSSVLFGLRRVAVHEDVTAVILRDVEAKKTPFVVATTDNSVYRAHSLHSKGLELVIEDASLGRIAVPLGSLAAIRVP